MYTQNHNKNFLYLSLINIRISGKNINFNDKKVKKSIFYKNKAIKNIEDIGYNDSDIIRPICIRLPQMTGYATKCDENATLSFMVKNQQLLKKCTKIWKTIEGLMKINFENKPVYDDDKYIKTKIKTYADSIITNFHNKKMPKEKAPCKCLSIIMIDSVIKANKKYF